MIDEKSHRRDDFEEEHCAWVTLADGQRWALQKPWVAIRPIVQNGKVERNFRLLTCGPELDELIAAIGRTPEFDDKVRGTQLLGAFLLARSYVLDDDDYEQLLTYRLDDPTSAEMVKGIIGVATGRDAPKAWGAGAD